MEKSIKYKTMVQVYDYEKIREYYKIIPGLFWSSHILVKTDKLENETSLMIETPKKIDKLFINGKLYDIKPSKKNSY